MDNLKAATRPFLDWYGIFASHRKEEADGRIWSQEPPTGVRLAIEPAKKSEVFFHRERPWEQDANLHINTMLYDEGRYRLWYGVAKVDDVAGTYVCYAESNDGFEWERPELGLVDYEGNSRNNIISAGRDHFLGSVFIDPNAPEAERYKAIGPVGRYYRDGVLDPDMDKQKFKELLVALDLGGVSAAEQRRKIEIRQAVNASVSPDGIHWTNLEEPILDVGNTALDTHNLAVWDPYEERYALYLRGHLERRRLVRRADSADFRSFPQARPCLMPDPGDLADDDIYNSCYTPYPGRQLYLMFPSLYHRIPSTVDVQLAVSHDSHTWLRPERKPIIDLSNDLGEDYGCIYASPNLIALNSGDWRLPFSGHYRLHDFLERGASYPMDTELRWAEWKKDRLVGLEAEGEGFVALVEKTCLGQEMRLNYRTEPGGSIKVELIKPPGTPPKEVEAVDGFSLAEAEPLEGDELAAVVRWKDNGDLSALEGQLLSVRLHLNKAKVYSIAM